MDREIVIPWLRFLWDTYRTVLDTLRNISKLELLYKSTAEQAFQFCLTHKRTMEFRRLSELLKAHMTHLKTHSAAQLDNPESFQVQLEIRLIQLSAAAQMELWQEAYKTVEEINLMVAPPKRTPPIEMMIVYYEKLAKIFWVSENYVFHTHALAKYHQLLAELKANKDAAQAEGADLSSSTPALVSFSKIALPEVNESELATQVLLAALSMPVAAGVGPHRSVQSKTSRQHVPLAIASAIEKRESLNLEVATDRLMSEAESNMQERLAKASTMYGFSDLEIDRDVVLHELISQQNILSDVVPEFADLYELLESKFQPLKLGKEVQAKLEALESVPGLKQYSKTITQLAFLRIIQQLGSVYQTLKLTRLSELIPFVAKDVIEKWTIRAIREKYIEAKVDHKHGFIIFQTSLTGAMFASDPSNAGVSSIGTSSSFESQRVRRQLVNVSRNLRLAVSVACDSQSLVHSASEARKAEKAKLFMTVAAEMEHERNRILKRREIIERTNLEREARIKRAEQERRANEKAARERAVQEEKERQEQKRKAAEERVQQQKAAELDAQKKSALVDKMIAAATKQGAQLDARAAEKLEKGTIDAQAYIDTQVKVLVQTHQRTEQRLKELVERADHLARARREAELPLLTSAAKERRESEAAQHETLRAKRVEEAKVAFERHLADKKRLARVADVRKAFESKILSARNAAFQKAEDERKQRESALQKKREEEAERKRQQDEIARKQEEERKKAQQEEEARRAEEREKAEAARPPKAASPAPGAAAPGGGGLNWAQRKALESGGSLDRPAGGAASGYRPPTSAGGYRPPGARGEDGGSSTGESGGAWRRGGGAGGSSTSSSYGNDGGDSGGAWKGRQGGGASGGSTYGSSSQQSKPSEEEEDGGAWKRTGGGGRGGNSGNTGSSGGSSGGGAYRPPARR